jgi:hypothetical protein
LQRILTELLFFLLYQEEGLQWLKKETTMIDVDYKKKDFR